VWDVAGPGDYPTLRAYTSEEPEESDEPDPEPDPQPQEDAPALVGGGGVVGLMGTTGTYKGIGYIAPRPQIIYPDGTVVYTENKDNSPLQLIDMYRQLLTLLEELLRQIQTQK
jgi:hypothetical protein